MTPKFIINPQIIFNYYDNKLFAFNKSTSELHQLNLLASIILKKYFKGKNRDTICKELSTVPSLKSQANLFNIIKKFELQLIKAAILIHKSHINNLLSFVGFDLTYNCNLNCKHCYLGNKRNEEQFSTDQVLQSISKLFNVGINLIEYSGGEIFLREDIFTILKYTNKLKIPFSIRSNGTLFNLETANILSKIDFLRMVHISLDGANDKVTSITRGTGQFQEIIKGIKNLVYHGIFPRIVFTCHRYNYNDIENTILLCIKLDIKQFYISPIFYQGNAIKNKMMLSEKQYYHFGTLIDDLSEKYSTKITIPSLKRRMKIFDSYSILKKACGLAQKGFSILPNGDIYPCRRLSEYPELQLGNILESVIGELILSKKYLEYKNFSVDNIEGCMNCSLKYNCGGGCRENAYRQTTRLNGKDPLCKFYYNDILLGAKNIKQSKMLKLLKEN